MPSGSWFASLKSSTFIVSGIATVVTSSISTSTTTLPLGEEMVERDLFENDCWLLKKKGNEIFIFAKTETGLVYMTHNDILLNFVWQSNPPSKYRKIPRYILKKYKDLSKVKRLL
jgi:hypothetical protein